MKIFPHGFGQFGFLWGFSVKRLEFAFLQASLGESKNSKGNEFVPLHVKLGDQKLVLGTLSTENFPQLSLDLVFEKEFELSHNWKSGSVYFCGYKSVVQDEYPFVFSAAQSLHYIIFFQFLVPSFLFLLIFLQLSM